MFPPPITHTHPEEVAGGCSRGGRTGEWGKDPAGRARDSGGAGPWTLGPNRGLKAPNFLGRGARRSSGRELAAAALRSSPKGVKLARGANKRLILKVRRFPKAAGDTGEPPPDPNHLKPPPTPRAELGVKYWFRTPGASLGWLWSLGAASLVCAYERKVRLPCRLINSRAGRRVAGASRALPCNPHPLTF